MSIIYLFLGGLPKNQDLSTIDAWVKYFKMSTDKRFDIVSHPINRDEELIHSKYLSTRIGKKCIIVPSNRWVHTRWGHFSLVEATILSMYYIHNNIKDYSKIILVDSSTMPLYTDCDMVNNAVRTVEGSFIPNASQWVTIDTKYLSVMFAHMEPTMKMVNERNVEIKTGDHYGYKWKIKADKSVISHFLNVVFNRRKFITYGGKIVDQIVLDERFFQRMFIILLAYTKNIKAVEKSILMKHLPKLNAIELEGELPVALFKSEYARTLSTLTCKPSDQKNTKHKVIIKDIISRNVVTTWEDYSNNINLKYSEQKNASSTFTDWTHFQLNFNNLLRFDKSVKNYKEIRSRIITQLSGSISNMSKKETLLLWKNIFMITIPPYRHPLEYISTDPIKCSVMDITEQECSKKICLLIFNLVNVLGNKVNAMEGRKGETSTTIDLLIKMMSRSVECDNITLTGLRGVNAFKVMYAYMFIVCYYGKGDQIFDLHKNTILVAKRTASLFIRKVNSNRKHVYKVLIDSNYDTKKTLRFNTSLYMNIEDAAISNIKYREILYTDDNMQVVLMSLLAGQDIAEETHIGSQFIRVERGYGWAIIGDKKVYLYDGFAITIPTNVKHYIKSISGLKLYTIYSPPQH